MNRGRAIAIVKQTLGFRTTHATEIGQLIDDAQDYLERNWPFEPLPWFMLTDRTESTTTAEEEKLALPEDFIQEYENDALWLQLDGGGERPLEKLDNDDARLALQQQYGFGEIAQATDELPLCYALTGEYWRLFPKPLTVQTIKVMYYKSVALTVDDSDTNAWLTHSPYSLIGHAGERMAVAMRDKDALGAFQGWKEAAITALANRNIERALANRRMAMGETR